MSLTVEKTGAVTLIKLNRPDRLNAIDKATAIEFQQAFRDFEASSDQRVAVLGGAGTSFCAGADIHDLPELWRCIPGTGFTSTKPIIMAPSGWCVGGAVVIAMTVDLIIASETTKFLYPEAKRGFTGGMIAGLAARLPHKIAMEVMLMGEPFSATRAYEAGLVNRVVKDGTEVDVAMEWAAKLAESAPLVTAAFKRVVSENILPVSPAELAARINRDTATVKTSRDRDEGVAAFKEKRKPIYLGR